MELLNVTVEEARRLIDLGADIDYIDAKGKSVLQCACKEGNLDIVKVLFENYVDKNYKNRKNKTALHYACKKGNLDIVKVLCENGAYVNIQDYLLDRPIHYAVMMDHLEVVKYLIEKYPNIKRKGILFNAIESGNIDILDFLLTLNLELNENKYNPLYWACVKGNIDAVDRLLIAGANPNIIDLYSDRDWTPIMETVSQNRLDIVMKLMIYGANYNCVCNIIEYYDVYACYNVTPLLLACKKDYTNISKFLIELGCDVNFCDVKIMKTALIYACENNNLEIVKLLLKRGADDGKAIDYCKSDEVRALFIK